MGICIPSLSFTQLILQDVKRTYKPCLRKTVASNNTELTELGKVLAKMEEEKKQIKQLLLVELDSQAQYLRRWKRRRNKLNNYC